MFKIIYPCNLLKINGWSAYVCICVQDYSFLPKCSFNNRWSLSWWKKLNNCTFSKLWQNIYLQHWVLIFECQKECMTYLPSWLIFKELISNHNMLHLVFWSYKYFWENFGQKLDLKKYIIVYLKDEGSNLNINTFSLKVDVSYDI